MLTSSKACDYLKRILSSKVVRRSKKTQRFFGEAWVATQIPHAEGYYGSFQWLTNRRFLTDLAFPDSPTKEFQEGFRKALTTHFEGQLERLQRNARELCDETGVKPAAPDLWLIDRDGNHRFIEVKLPRDSVRDNQLAGLAVIAASFRSKSHLSFEIIELHPDNDARFAEFVHHVE